MTSFLTFDSGEFSFKIKGISKRMLGISFGTDVIVGFPGERVTEFQRTYNMEWMVHAPGQQVIT